MKHHMLLDKKPVHVARVICLLIFLFAAACQGPISTRTPEATKAANWPTQTWQTSTPEQQGLDSGKLADLLAAVQSQQINLHSLLVIRNGYLVLEANYPPYTPDIRHTVESNTKSIIGALIGIAIEQGKIKSVDQKLIDFFPQRYIYNVDEQKKSISLKDLLSMTSGLDCTDFTSGGDGMYQTRVWVQYLLDQPVLTEPGKKWAYCSGSAHLLSAVLQEATGMDARTYANQVLFQPLGIPAVSETDWGADPQHVTNGIAGLYLTPRELAKFGLLYLNKGNWDGQQVVPAQWVADSTREQAYIGKDEYVGGLDRRFGYLFSIFPDQKYYGYLGRAGQELFVLPEKKMVVVFTGSLAVGKEGELLKLINDYLLPAAKSDQPLPDSPQASARLQSLLPSAEKEKQVVKPLPQIALAISGKTYRLEQNPLGWTTLAFVFDSQPGAREAVIQMEGSPDLKVGLDGVFRLTDIPKYRPLAIRATWKSNGELYLEFMTLGEYSERTASIKFQEKEISLSAYDVNFGGDPIVVHGTIQ